MVDGSWKLTKSAQNYLDKYTQKRFNQNLDKIIKHSSSTKKLKKNITEKSTFLGRIISKRNTDRYLVNSTTQKQLATEIQNRTIAKTADFIKTQPTNKSSLKDINGIKDIFSRFKNHGEQDPKPLYQEFEQLLTIDPKSIVDESVKSVTNDVDNQAYLSDKVKIKSIKDFLYQDKLFILKELAIKAKTPKELEFMHGICKHLSQNSTPEYSKDLDKIRKKLDKKAIPMIKSFTDSYKVGKHNIRMEHVKDMVYLVSLCKEDNIDISSLHKKIHKFFRSAISDWTDSLQLRDAPNFIKNDPQKAQKMLTKSMKELRYFQRNSQFSSLFGINSANENKAGLFPYKNDKERKEFTTKYILPELEHLKGIEKTFFTLKKLFPSKSKINEQSKVGDLQVQLEAKKQYEYKNSSQQHEATQIPPKTKPKPTTPHRKPNKLIDKGINPETLTLGRNALRRVQKEIKTLQNDPTNEIAEQEPKDSGKKTNIETVFDQNIIDPTTEKIKPKNTELQKRENLHAELFAKLQKRRIAQNLDDLKESNKQQKINSTEDNPGAESDSDT